jgi:hypothetical protein
MPNYYPLTNGGLVEATPNRRVTMQLAPTSEAVCYFVKLGGEFVGNQEWVRIEPRVMDGREWWVLDARAIDGHVYGQARCLQYNQRSEVIPPL